MNKVFVIRVFSLRSLLYIYKCIGKIQLYISDRNLWCYEEWELCQEIYQVDRGGYGEKKFQGEEEVWIRSMGNFRVVLKLYVI